MRGVQTESVCECKRNSVLDLLLLLSLETANKNLLSAPFTVDFGDVNTCLLTIRIKLTSSFPGRRELSDIMTAGFIDLMGGFGVLTHSLKFLWLNKNP